MTRVQYNDLKHGDEIEDFFGTRRKVLKRDSRGCLLLNDKKEEWVPESGVITWNIIAKKYSSLEVYE